MAMRAMMVVAVSMALAGFASASEMELQLLSSYENAKCLDGSPSGYYVQKSTTGSSDWVMFLQGGGACETISGCIARSKTNLGSSKHWGKTRSETDNLLATNCSFNPFCDFNHVWVPYCSGDVYVGQATKPDAIGLQFSGHLTVQAIVQDLQANHGLGATPGQRLLLAGSSAGGIGTFVNADFVSSLLPSVDVKANPQGGFFFPNVTAYPYWTAGKFMYPENNTEIALFDAYLNPDCVKENGETALCNDLFFLYKYIKTPLFVAENQYDSNQLFAQLHCPEDPSNPTATRYIQYFGTHMRDALSHVVAPNGLWTPSCVCHTSNLNMENSPAVDGVTLATALSNWYFKGQQVHLVEACPSGGTLPCNPDCNCR